MCKTQLKKAIYKITNKLNGKSYIGQSVDPQHRFSAHISRSKNDTDNSPLHAAMNKYGKENFTIEILEWTPDYNQREQELIQEYGTLVPNGYNLAKGGEEPPHKYGEEHHNSVISEEQVSIVINELKYGERTESEIGRLFSPPFNQCLIHNINHGITHRRADEVYPIRTESPYHLTASEVEEIKWLLKETSYPCSQIADHFRVNNSTVKAINTGRNYPDSRESYPLRKTRGQAQSQPVETILAKRSTDAIDTRSEMGVCP